MPVLSETENTNHLIEEARRQVRNRTFVQTLVVLPLLLITLLDPIMRVGAVSRGLAPGPVMAARVVLPLLAILVPLVHFGMDRVPPSLVRLIERLSAIDDIAVVPVLLELHPVALRLGAHSLFGKKTGDKLAPFRQLIDALKRLLPQVSEFDYRTFGEHGRKAVYAFIKSEKIRLTNGSLTPVPSTASVIAALDLLVRAEDRHALPMLRGLLRGTQPAVEISNAVGRTIQALER